MDSPKQPSAPSHFKPMTLALAGFGLALVAVLTVAFQQLPVEYRVWNVSVIGGLALFAAARLGFWPGVAFTAAAIALKDVCYYRLTDWWEPYPLSWAYFSVYALVGWVLLRRSASAGRVAVTALGVSLGFFVVSNFVSWLEQALPYGYSFEGLVNCYAAAVPFYRGTFLGDLMFSVGLFGAHAVLSRAYFPAERVSAATKEVRDTEGHW
ncbi:MAG: hypothetical protein J0I06_15070 [Planctomycetes bacterium]|nr:hypothetical protein [Planctomycetota bacterium]